MRKNKPLYIRISEEDNVLFREACSKLKLDLSEFVRQATRKAALEAVKPEYNFFEDPIILKLKKAFTGI